MLAICNGMPRAGSTLQYNVARCLVEKASVGQAEAFVTTDKAHPRRIDTAQLAEWAEDSLWHVVKTHEVFDALPALLSALLSAMVLQQAALPASPSAASPSPSSSPSASP